MVSEKQPQIGKDDCRFERFEFGYWTLGLLCARQSEVRMARSAPAAVGVGEARLVKPFLGNPCLCLGVPYNYIIRKPIGHQHKEWQEAANRYLR